MRTSVVRSTFILLIAFLSGLVHAEVAIIANLANPESSLSANEAKKIFLGKRASFPSGSWVTPVDLSKGSATRDIFYKKLATKNSAQMSAYWSKLIFSGKATPPKELPDDVSVKAWIANNKDGLGYINIDSVDTSIKVLLILQ